MNILVSLTATIVIGYMVSECLRTSLTDTCRSAAALDMETNWRVSAS